MGADTTKSNTLAALRGGLSFAPMLDVREKASPEVQLVSDRAAFLQTWPSSAASRLQLALWRPSHGSYALPSHSHLLDSPHCRAESCGGETHPRHNENHRSKLTWHGSTPSKYLISECDHNGITPSSDPGRPVSSCGKRATDMHACPSGSGCSWRGHGP